MVPSTFRFYTNSGEAWNSMLLACKEAKVSIEIEHYIFASYGIGERFLEVLKEKSKDGVKVRLLVDAVGSYPFYASKMPVELQRAGIDVRFFNPISPWRIHTFTSWFFRNHKKVIVVDGKVGFTGGLGIRDDMAPWRDTNARLEGDVVLEMADSFEETWELSENKKLMRRIQKVRTQSKKGYFITNSPYFKKRFLYHTFVDALRSARTSIQLTTPYFIPDRRLMRVLKLAVRRGVDVKILVPDVFDVPLVETASNSSLSEPLRAGIRIFKYQPVFLHAKTAIVDGEWATFGSFNLDSLSFVYNFEGNVVCFDPKCCEELAEHFKQDLHNSKEIKMEEWINRPLLWKIQEFFIAPIRGFL